MISIAQVTKALDLFGVVGQIGKTIIHATSSSQPGVQVELSQREIALVRLSLFARLEKMKRSPALADDCKLCEALLERLHAEYQKF